MLHAMYRALSGAALVLCLACGQAIAQPAKTVPAPERNIETGLVFPSVLGPSTRGASIDYGKSRGAPEIGYAWNYETRTTTTTFYVYNGGIGSIPSGTSEVVLQQFEQAQRDIDAGARAGRYDDLTPSTGPGDCKVGTMVFRCITYSASLPQNKQQVFTRLFITGYRNSFFKVRQDWLRDPAGGLGDVDATLRALVNSAGP